MTKARTRLLLCAVLAAGALSAVAPSSASAVYESYYNCVLKPSGQWCDGQANGSYDGIHSYDSNYVWYPGEWDGSVLACQRVRNPSTGFVLGNGCGYNFIAAYYGTVTCVCYEAEAKQVSGGPHSINGYATA